MHFYASDGQHKAILTDGLAPEEYVEKANELVEPTLRKSYEDIRKKVESDCKGLRQGERSLIFEVVQPEDLAELHGKMVIRTEKKVEDLYMATCPHLFL